MRNKSKHVMSWSNRVIKLASAYNRVKRQVDRLTMATHIIESKIAELLVEHNVTSFQDLKQGVSVYKKDDVDYEYDIAAIKEIMGDDFHKIAVIDIGRFNQAVEDYPMIMKHKRPVAQVTSIAIAFDKPEEEGQNA